MIFVQSPLLLVTIRGGLAFQDGLLLERGGQRTEANKRRNRETAKTGQEEPKERAEIALTR